MQATKTGAILVPRPAARRPPAIVIAMLVVAVLLSVLVVWRVTGAEQHRDGAPTRDVVSTIEVDPPTAGAHRSKALPKRGGVEFAASGPHPPGSQPKDG